tara:strand:+ start:9795 stop:11099 length:1305 start_codon:yes stop_codon:yes gene_type:complete
MTVFTLNKNLKILMPLLFIINVAFGQICGADEYNKKFMDADPEKYKIIEQRLQERLNYSNNRSVTEVIVPVVFHVVWKDSIENLHDSIIHAQLDVLNESFNLQNSDTSILTDTLKKWKGNFHIRFELATKDPDGNSTDGITRTHTSQSSFSYYTNAIKNDSTGGKSPWNTKRYMNIWVGDLMGGLLGYSQFPGGPDSLDGNAVDYAVFGDRLYPWTYSPFFAKGRVLVHEIGHWLNLFHPWGNSGGCSEDYIPETGRQYGPTYTTAGCPDTLFSMCHPAPQRVFVKHYMDYSGDACMVTFTKGQVERGLASLWDYRSEMIEYSELVTEEIDTFISIKVYPNPTKQRLYLELPEYEGVLTIMVFDILGKLILTDFIHGERSKEILLQGFSNGTYVLQILNESNVLFNKKIMIDNTSPWGSQIYIEDQPIEIKNTK